MTVKNFTDVDPYYVASMIWNVSAASDCSWGEEKLLGLKIDCINLVRHQRTRGSLDAILKTLEWVETYELTKVVGALKTLSQTPSEKLNINTYKFDTSTYVEIKTKGAKSTTKTRTLALPASLVENLELKAKECGMSVEKLISIKLGV